MLTFADVENVALCNLVPLDPRDGRHPQSQYLRNLSAHTKLSRGTHFTTGNKKIIYYTFGGPLKKNKSKGRHLYFTFTIIQNFISNLFPTCDTE